MTSELVGTDLAAMLVETGLWDIDRALANARRYDTGESRCRALITLLPHVPEARKAAVTREAMLQAVRHCENGVRGGGGDPLVDELAPALTAQDWPEILSQVEAAMVPFPGGDALTPLVPHLPDELLGRALAIAALFPPNIHRTIALEKLARRLPGEAAVAALAPAREITDPKYRADVLTALLPRLPRDVATRVRDEARAAVGAIDPPVDHDDPVRRQRWTGLIPVLPAEERTSAITEALAGEDDAMGRANLLTDVARELPAHERSPYTAEALKAARTITTPFARAQLLIMIVELLPLTSQKATLAEAAEATREIAELFDRAHTLIDLADQVPATEREALLDEALADARRVDDADDRAYLLTAIADRLPLHRQGPPLAEAVRAAHAVQNPDRRFRLLMDTADGPPGAERREALAAALKLRLDDVDYENYFNGPVLDALAPVLPEDLMIQMLEAVRDTGRLGYLARVLHDRAKHMSGAALEAGLAMARTITGEGRAHQRAAVLTVLSDRLPPERRGRVLDEALAAAREAGSDLTRIARRLPEERRVALLAEQLDP